jgi:hypothetical protein
MARLFGFVALIGIISAGLLLVLGTYLRWPRLIDPPSDWGPFYSQALIKRMFGRSFLIGYTYALGVLIVVAGVAAFVNELCSH